MTEIKRKRAPGGGRKPRPNTRRVNIRIDEGIHEMLKETGNVSAAIEEMAMATPKYIVQHVGYPTTSPIPAEAWKTYSEHLTESAAWKRIRKATEHLSAGSWDDHYRVIAPDGTQCDLREYQARVEADEAWRRQRERQDR